MSHKPLNLPATLPVFTACRGHCTQPSMQIHGCARRHRYSRGCNRDAARDAQAGMATSPGTPRQMGSHGWILTEHWSWRYTQCAHQSVLMHICVCAQVNAPRCPPWAAPVDAHQSMFHAGSRAPTYPLPLGIVHWTMVGAFCLLQQGKDTVLVALEEARMS